MPQALQTLIFGSDNLAGTTFDPLTPGTGDPSSFYVTAGVEAGYIAEVWGLDNASPMQVSLTASRFTDPTLGIVYSCPDGSTLAPNFRATLLSSPGIDQPIYSGDTMTVSALGTSADEVVVVVTVRYEALPGIDANLYTAQQVQASSGNQIGITVSTTPGDSDWGATAALNSSDSRLKAGKKYAVLGFTSQSPIAAVTIAGPDVGNLRMGGPVIADGDHDATLFYDLAQAYNQPFIPVIQGLNAGATNIQSADTDATATTINVQMVEVG